MKIFNFLNKHLHFVIPTLIIKTILDIIYALCGIFFSLSIKELIDVATSGSSDDLLIRGIILVSIIIGQILIQFISVMLLIHMRGKVRTKLQHEIFSNLISQNELDEHSGTYLAKITSDTSYVTDGVCSLIPKISLSITKFVAAFVALGIIDYILVICIFILGIILVVSHFIYKKFLARYHKDYQNKEANSQAFIQEMIENQANIHAFGKESFIIKEEDRRLSELYKAEVKRSSISIFANLGLSIGMLGSYALIIVYGAFRISNGSPIYDEFFTVGSLMAIMSLFTQLEAPLASVADVNHRYIMFKESTKRIMSIFKEPKISDDIKDFENISIDDFSFSYHEKCIFKNTNFKLKKGESITILGPSGIGKSTLIKILLGRLKADKPILVDGRSLDLGNLISYVPQGNWLLSGTIRDNLTLYDESIKDEDIKAILKVVAIEEFGDILDQNIKERAKDISEGQAQRLSIARGLLLNRPILLLDEVTSALDSKTEKIVLKNLSSLGKTIIYISHKEATNSYSNRIYEIKDNKLWEVSE